MLQRVEEHIMFVQMQALTAISLASASEEFCVQLAEATVALDVRMSELEEAVSSFKEDHDTILIRQSAFEVQGKLARLVARRAITAKEAVSISVNELRSLPDSDVDQEQLAAFLAAHPNLKSDLKTCKEQGLSAAHPEKKPMDLGEKGQQVTMAHLQAAAARVFSLPSRRSAAQRVLVALSDLSEALHETLFIKIF